jgi:hypothetical protein
MRGMFPAHTPNHTIKIFTNAVININIHSNLLIFSFKPAAQAYLCLADRTITTLPKRGENMLHMQSGLCQKLLSLNFLEKKDTLRPVAQ